jgi:hypothetical protein
VNILVLGTTGVGKSAFCNVVTGCVGETGAPAFAESARVVSQTADMQSAMSGAFRVVDSPGLQDSGGMEADRENIRKMVTYAKALGYINAFVIVRNSQCPRLDDGMLSGIKLYADSFGHDILRRTAFVYTRAFVSDADELAESAADSTRLIGARCAVDLEGLPFWAVECHPERYGGRRVSAACIAQAREDTQEQVGRMLEWASEQTRYSTAEAIFGEYEQVQSSFSCPFNPFLLTFSPCYLFLLPFRACVCCVVQVLRRKEAERLRVEAETLRRAAEQREREEGARRAEAEARQRDAERREQEEAGRRAEADGRRAEAEQREQEEAQRREEAERARMQAEQREAVAEERRREAEREMQRERERSRLEGLEVAFPEMQRQRRRVRRRRSWVPKKWIFGIKIGGHHRHVNVVRNEKREVKHLRNGNTVYGNWEQEGSEHDDSSWDVSDI